MDVTKYKNKIEAIIAKDYSHELPDKPRSAEFNRVIKSMLKAMFPDCTILQTKGTWCYASGFIKSERTGKCVYYCFDDYRYCVWNHSILIRSAKDETDYTGGANRYTSLEDMRRMVYGLLGME